MRLNIILKINILHKNKVISLFEKSDSSIQNLFTKFIITKCTLISFNNEDSIVLVQFKKEKLKVKKRN